MFSILSGRTMTTAKRHSETQPYENYKPSQTNKEVRAMMHTRGSYNQTPNIQPNKQFDNYLNMSSYQMSNGSDQVSGMSRRIDQIKRLNR